MVTIYIFSLPRPFFWEENPNENQNNNLCIHKIRSFTKLHENFTANCKRKVLLHFKNDNKRGNIKLRSFLYCPFKFIWISVYDKRDYPQRLRRAEDHNNYTRTCLCTPQKISYHFEHNCRALLHCSPLLQRYFLTNVISGN